ncbi:MAG: hypothetical protein ACE5GW_12210 [Planctomycetota bacterium]
MIHESPAQHTVGGLRRPLHGSSGLLARSFLAPLLVTLLHGILPALPPGGADALAESSPALVVRIAFEARAPGEILRLEQIAELAGDPQGIWPAVKGLLLRSADGRSFSRGLIERRLRGAGLPARAYRLIGPAICEVKGP